MTSDHIIIEGVPTAPVVKAYYCQHCRADVFLTNGIAALPMKCERCKGGLMWIEGSIAEIESYLGIPSEDWVDLTK